MKVGVTVNLSPGQPKINGRSQLRSHSLLNTFVTTPPAPALSLTPSFSFLALLTTYFNELTTIYLSQSNTLDKNKFPLFDLDNTIKG